jgi:hypothetical protein
MIEQIFGISIKIQSDNKIKRIRQVPQNYKGLCAIVENHLKDESPQNESVPPSIYYKVVY